jgi:hypothetical protein
LKTMVLQTQDLVALFFFYIVHATRRRQYSLSTV